MAEHEMQEEVAANDTAPEVAENVADVLQAENTQLKRTVAELKVVLMQLQAQLNQTQAQLINIEFQRAQSELQALGPAQPANTHLMP